jgi:hypothetical protein
MDFAATVFVTARCAAIAAWPRECRQDDRKSVATELPFDTSNHQHAAPRPEAEP